MGTRIWLSDNKRRWKL